jgi:dTDP-L-rhamnose 4-epimerase
MADRILLTGGAGFIGSYVCDLLCAKGYKVIVVDNLDPQVHLTREWPQWRNPKAEYHQGECSDPQVWREWLPKIDAVIHLAAAVGVGQSQYQIAYYVQANTMATALMLDAIVNGEQRPRKLVVAASMSSYGEGLYRHPSGKLVSPDLRPLAQMQRHQWELIDSDGEMLTPVPTPETKPQLCNSIYAITKKDQEDMVLNIGQAYNIPAVALRFFNVFGPRQSLSNPYTGVAAIFLSRLRNGNAPLIFEDGKQSRDFISVHDIAAAVVQALETDGCNGKSVNVGTGQPRTVKQVAETLAQILRVDIQPQITEKYRAGDVRHCVADNTLLRIQLGYTPHWSFTDAMSELVDWSLKVEARDKVDQATAELKQRGLIE